MKYILYFDGYDNDTYFYKTIEQLLENWHCKTLEEFKEKHKRKYFCILKIEEVILESEVN
ncbi:MAG: hypothetical protein IKU37_01480 [Candidatus Gastranaerophilales bacterium]|nr:hypothetical protein [Candidatus Gastranaerophilales bacterium]